MNFRQNKVRPLKLYFQNERSLLKIQNSLQSESETFKISNRGGLSLAGGEGASSAGEVRSGAPAAVGAVVGGPAGRGGLSRGAAAVEEEEAGGGQGEAPGPSAECGRAQEADDDGGEGEGREFSYLECCF